MLDMLVVVMLMVGVTIRAEDFPFCIFFFCSVLFFFFSVVICVREFHDLCT